MTTFIVFVFIPVVWAFIISFQKYSLRTGGKWMDPIYANYETAFTQFGGIFISAIQNTIVYSIFTVTANIFLGLILSSLIQPLSHRLRTFFRAAYYLPAVTSALIIGMTWSFIYNAQWGFANYILRLLGLPLVRWISDPDIALASVTASAILTIPATAVVLYSAAMGASPPSITKPPSSTALTGFKNGGTSPCRSSNPPRSILSCCTASPALKCSSASTSWCPACGQQHPNHRHPNLQQRLQRFKLRGWARRKPLSYL